MTIPREILQKELAFVVYYHNDNKYSFNALIGALETDTIIEKIDIYLISDKEKIITDLKEIFQIYKKIVIGISFFTTQLWDVFELIKILKKKYENKTVFIAGGPHPTGDPLGTLRIGASPEHATKGSEPHAVNTCSSSTRTQRSTTTLFEEPTSTW